MKVQTAAAASPPLLSVTLLNYNYAAFLSECIASILDQSFTDFELIIIDDCSSDNSLEVIRPHLHDHRVRLIEHSKNAGFVSSLLEGVAESSGRYITVVSADDVIASTRAFEKQISLLESNPLTSFCYAAWTYLTGNGERISQVVPWSVNHVWPGEAEFRAFCTRYYVLHTGTIIRRTAYEKTGGYDASIRYTLDNTLWALLCGVGDVAYVAEPFYGYRTHQANMSHRSDAIRATVAEFVRLVDQGFERLPDCLTKRDRRLRRRARQAALVGVATMQIFAGNARAGWLAVYYAAQLSPIETLAQKRIVSLIARFMLGPHRFLRARDVVSSARALWRGRVFSDGTIARDGRPQLP